MNLIFYLTIIITFSLYIFFYQHLKNKLITQKSLPHQLFTSQKSPPLLGGFFLITFFFLFSDLDLNLKLFFFIIFLLGVFSDYKILNSPKIRILLQVLTILFFVNFIDLGISSTRFDILDEIIKIDINNLIFTSFCLLILINGFNFIDGLNGLTSGYFLIVFMILTLFHLETSFIKKDFIYLFIFVLIILFILNLFNKIYLGDSGSYFLGFLLGTYSISVFNENNFISPFYIILLLWYPCFENLFSILRKKSFNLSPLNPDNSHLHQIIFSYLNKKIRLKSNMVNNLSSILILAYNVPIFVISTYFNQNTKFQIFMIIFNITVYVASYYFLRRKILNT